MPRGYQRAPVYDETKGTVHIWARDGRAPSRLTNLIGGDVRRQVNDRGNQFGASDDFAEARRLLRGGPRADQRRHPATGTGSAASMAPSTCPPSTAGWPTGIARAVDVGDDVTIWVG